MRTRPRATRKPYPSTVTDDEWAFIAPYLTLCREDAPQRHLSVRHVYNALRWVVRAGAPWRYLPNDFPPWEMVYQHTQRRIAAGGFEAIVHDLRALLRVAEDRESAPGAVVRDGRTLQRTPESGARAGYDGAKRRKGSKVHIAVDTLGHLLALRVTAADEQERAQVGALADDVQLVTGETVTLAYVDQGYTGATAADAQLTHGIQLDVVSSRRPSAALSCSPPVGGRALLRVARALPASRTGLRTPAGHLGGPPLNRVCVPVAASRGLDIRKFITPSGRSSGPLKREGA